MTIPVVCAACGGPCRGHVYRCIDCGVIGGHTATCDGLIAVAMRIELDAIAEDLRADLTARFDAKIKEMYGYVLPPPGDDESAPATR